MQSCALALLPWKETVRAVKRRKLPFHCYLSAILICIHILKASRHFYRKNSELLVFLGSNSKVY